MRPESGDAPARTPVNLEAIAAEVAAQGVIIALLRLKLLVQKAGFDPNQPRVPAGNSYGGQWTDTGGTGNAGSGGGAIQRTPPKHSNGGTTETDQRNFVTAHRSEAQKLATALGQGATAQEFLALSSVETNWGTSDAAKIANNYFGLHNRESGPYPGQIGTYLTSGKKGVPGQIIPEWIPPRRDSSPEQAVAIFSSATGYIDSGSFVMKRLSKLGDDYSNPATFFATIRALGWAKGTTPTEYVRVLLQRHRRVSQY